jgi:hypothetical protein
MSIAMNNNCRLCSSECTEAFSKVVLSKYSVRYWKCTRCLSLQTDEPFWLDEAYSHNLADFDTGAAQRNIQNLAATYSVAALLRFDNLLDIGGGDGLLCRLLRDYGLNAYCQDKYATPAYSHGFSAPNFDAPDLLTAFEVLEHFPHPLEQIEELFSDQGPNWWYIAPASGQHVFFYSRKALIDIGKRFGYELLFAGQYTLFTRTGLLTGLQRTMLRMLLSPKGIRVVRIALQIKSTPGVWQDFLQKTGSGRTDQP